VFGEVAGDRAGGFDLHRLRLGGCRGGVAGHQIGHTGADRDPADVVFPGRRGDAGAVEEGLADFLDGTELFQRRPPSGLRAGGAGGGETVAGEFVLQVAQELLDRGQHVDQHRVGCVPGGQIAAEPVELGDGQSRPGVPGQLADPGALERGNFDDVAGSVNSRTREQVDLPRGALSVVKGSVDDTQLSVGVLAVGADGYRALVSSGEIAPGSGSRGPDPGWS
jgi:hypothetical protein